MPAAAVIPAPLAYIKVVAVKKLVVEFWARSIGLGPLRPLDTRKGLVWLVSIVRWERAVSSLNRVRSVLVQVVYLGMLCFSVFTLRKLECSQQAVGV